jgi:tetratricopeptide (TPR) repeat protein
MGDRIVKAINGILILIIVAVCVWAFPYAASSFHILRGRKALEAAQQSPAGLELYARAFDDLQQAVRWDENNTEAIELLPQASRQLVRGYVEGGRLAEVEPALDVVLEQNPEDQFALYYLARIYEEEGEVEQAVEIYQTLRYFELGEDGKPPAYLGGLVAKLEQYGLWEREQVINVVSYLVWQEAQEQAGELLGYLEETYPEQPDWSFYRGELYHRQGDLERAEAAYWQALAADAEYAQAYLRLGMLAEEGGRQGEGEEREWYLSGAARWYGQYHEMAPDDLLGLERLVETCAALEKTGGKNESCRDAAALREELESKTDDRRIVAELLHVPVESVELEPNLVENGGFEDWVDEEPDWWIWSNMATGNPWNKGVFVGGADMLGAQLGNTARVDGLWLQDHEDKEEARCGYWQWDEEQRALRSITVTVGSPYLLSFYYRTERLADGAAAVWTSSDPMILFAHDRELPGTHGAWQRFIAVGWNRSGAEATIGPMIRSFATGSVAFDDVQVHQIELAKGIETETRETQFRIIGSD